MPHIHLTGCVAATAVPNLGQGQRWLDPVTQWPWPGQMPWLACQINGGGLLGQKLGGEDWKTQAFQWAWVYVSIQYILQYILNLGLGSLSPPPYLLKPNTSFSGGNENSTPGCPSCPCTWPMSRVRELRWQPLSITSAFIKSTFYIHLFRENLGKESDCTGF